MLTLKFGFTFEFTRDKSADKLVKEHEYELLKLKNEKEKEKRDGGKTG